jgi:hypothetical protein
MDDQARRILEARAQDAGAGNDPVYDAGQAVLPENLRGQKFTDPRDQANYRDFSRFAANTPEVDFGAGEVTSAAQREVVRRKMEQDRARAELAKFNQDGIQFAEYNPADAAQRIERSQQVFADNKAASDVARKQIGERQDRQRMLSRLPEDYAAAELGAKTAEAKSREMMAGAMDPELAKSAIRAQQEAQVAQARAQAGVAQNAIGRQNLTNAYDAPSLGYDRAKTIAESVANGANLLKSTTFWDGKSSARTAESVDQQLAELENILPTLPPEQQAVIRDNMLATIGLDADIADRPAIEDALNAAGEIFRPNPRLVAIRRIQDRINRLKKMSYGGSSTPPATSDSQAR